MPVRVIRSLDDFLAVPEAELTNCMTAFRRAIEAHKRLQGTAAAGGTHAAAVPFREFVWKPREDERPALAQVTCTTPVEDLGLKPAAVRKFRDLNLYALEDFAQATEHELRRVPDVGPSTVAQVRELLEAVGLAFRPPTHPWVRAEQQAKVARALAPEDRARRISDESDIADLGLRGPTLTRCLEKGINTVGQLRRMTLRDLYVPFGSQSLIDLLSCLDAVGKPLYSAPSQLERWKYRAIARESLDSPAEEQPVIDLQPWIGAAAEHFDRAGISTVGELRRVAAAGGRHVRGVGQSSWDRVFDHFGLRRKAIPRSGSSPAGERPATA